MRKFDLSLRSSRSSYFATFRHQLTILSKTDALDEEKWLNMLGTFVKDWFRYESHMTVNAGNGGFLHCIQMDTSVNAANQVVSVGADIAFDADPKFFACLVRFESSSVPTTLPTAYDVYPLDGRHDGGYYTVKDCVTIDVLPRTP